MLDLLQVVGTVTSEIEKMVIVYNPEVWWFIQLEQVVHAVGAESYNTVRQCNKVW